MRRWFLMMCLVWAATTAAFGEGQATRTLEFEAEQATRIVGRAKDTTRIPDANGGEYVYLEQGTKTPEQGLAGHLVLEFESAGGGCTVAVRAAALGGGTDSVFISVDGGRFQSVGIPQTKRWTWVERAGLLRRDGRHEVIIAAREPARIDKVRLTIAPLRPVMHQTPLMTPEPNGWRPVDINPPTLRWPGDREHDYEVQWSQSRDFNGAATVIVAGATFQRPLKPWTPGKWYWRVRERGAQRWWPTCTFDLPADTPEWEIPDWDAALARVPKGHPRLWIRPEQVAELRRGVRRRLGKELAQWMDRHDKMVGAPFPLQQDPETPQASDYRSKVNRRVASKSAGMKTAGPAGSLAWMHLLTGKADYAREAIRRAMALTRLDPQGFTSHAISDFGDAAIVVGLARVYDYLYDELTPEQRQTISATIIRRLQLSMPGYVRRSGQNPYNAHAFQHVIQDLTAGCLAVYDEHPEARDWFRWSLQVHVALYPWYGGRDGGSAEGANYFTGTNMLTSMSAAELFAHATGISLYGNPWFQNNWRYILYSHPLGGIKSRFGDGSIGGPPTFRKRLAMRHYASLWDNGYCSKYAAECGDGVANGYQITLQSLWWEDQPPHPRSLSQLPRAAAFRDIGVAFMHSAIDDPANNIMFEFKSSPYGSLGHGHADQNSFNIAAFGKPLVSDTGYYIGYGDKHHYGWTVRTRAHNTILINETEQGFQTARGYGRLTAFHTTPQITYVAGDASQAYLDTEVLCFNRHIVWIHPGTYVVFDHLVTPEPTRFDWLLHAENEMQVDATRRRATLQTGVAQALVSWMAPTSLSFKQTDQFTVPPEAWRPGRKRGPYPNQWHLTVTPTTQRAEERFLTVVDVRHPLAAAVYTPCRLVESKEWLGVERSAPNEFFIAFSKTGAAVHVVHAGLDVRAQIAATTKRADGHVARLIWPLPE